MRVTKWNKLVILDHLRVVTVTCGALETLLIVVTGYEGYQNDRATPGNIVIHPTPASVET